MTDRHPIVSSSFNRTLTTCATARDGRHSATTFDLSITVHFAPLDPWQPHVYTSLRSTHQRQWEDFDHWLSLYVDGHDLTGTLDFAPTPERIALYLARVLAGMAPEAVGLSLASGNEHHSIAWAESDE